MKKRTELLSKLQDVFQNFQSQPIQGLIEIINPVLRGWVNYFRISHAKRCFGYVERWVEKKLRRHIMRAKNHQGFGWDRWSREWLYKNQGLYSNYRLKYYQAPKALPA
jgi:RNA-directed DNA polymerase